MTPSGESAFTSALYFKNAYVPSARLFALDASFVYASQYSCLLLCAPMDLELSLSFSSVAARSAAVIPHESARTMSSCDAIAVGRRGRGGDAAAGLRGRARALV
eukprot:18522-Pelagococcus_subviridis.AAC.12